MHIKCSDADRITITGQTRFARVKYSDGIPVTEATFSVPANCGYFRLTITDKSGKYACTNAYFIDDLKG